MRSVVIGFGSVLVVHILASCNNATITPDAKYVSPFAAGISPARLYVADVRNFSGLLTAYNLRPICARDFTMANELKALTASPSLSFGTLTITDGPAILAGLSGIPVSSFVKASGGIGFSDRNTMTFTNAQLIQVDNEGAPVVIANYIKRRGPGTAENPRCLDIVQAALQNRHAVIVTKGVITAEQANITPDAPLGTASCGGGDSGGAASGDKKGSNGKSADKSKANNSDAGSQTKSLIGSLLGSGSSAGSGTAKTSNNEKKKKNGSNGEKKSTPAPISGCVGVNLGSAVSFNVKAAGGTSFTQSVRGAVIAILPADLPL